jgi:hypothetical protein
VLATGGIVTWQLAGHFFGQRTGPDKLVNQVWLERWPKDPRDMVWHFVAIDHERHQLGRLGRASRWRVASDGFVWRQEGARLDARFPQNGCRSTLVARTWKCAGEAPKPFDLCLELKAGDRVFNYYSRTDWVVRPHGDLPAELDWLASSLPTPLALEDEEAPAGGDCALPGPSESEE